MTSYWLSSFFLLLCCTSWFLFPGDVKYPIPNPDRASQAIVSACTELALDSALTGATDGTSISFDCSGSILITSTKIISRRLTLDAHGQSVILTGKSLIFKIDRQ